jgi:predicted DNA-binding transcriptional regulator AlpA
MAGPARLTFLQIKDLMARYGVTKFTIAAWMRDCGFPRPIQISRRRFWRLSEVEAYEASKRKSP